MDPFNQFRRLTDQMERWFEGVGMRGSGRAADMGMNLWAPEIETFMRDDQFVVRADLPGLNKDEVNIEVTDDSLVLHGERQKSHEEERTDSIAPNAATGDSIGRYRCPREPSLKRRRPISRTACSRSH